MNRCTLNSLHSIVFILLLVGALFSISCAFVNKQRSTKQNSKLVLNVAALGAKGDGVTDDTKFFQKAIDSVAALGGGTVLVPHGKYLIDADTSVKLKSGVTLQMTDTAAQLIAKPTRSDRSYIVMVLNAIDVNIIGGKIVGDRNEHLGNTGEWGMGIAVYASKNVIINGTKIFNCWGDGIVIGAKGGAPFNAPNPSINVVVKNVTSDNNRRQAITIGKVNHVIIDSCILTNTNGTKPMSAIDIEPDKDTAQNITIQNCVMAYNKGNGIEMFVNSKSAVRNVSVKNNFIHHNSYGGYVIRARNIEFSDNRIIQNKYMPPVKAVDTVNCVLARNVYK
jgi:hypothetical protein